MTDYLVTKQDTLTRIGTAVSSGDTREKLLVYQEQNELSLSLYLHQGIVNRIDSSSLELKSENLEDFCLALEGISHFLYIVWNASFDRCVTMLEMELQAEVDKFIMLEMYLRRQHITPLPGQIRGLLFGSVKYHDHLTGEELQRYRDANNFAEKYCWYLETRNYLRDDSKQELHKELRRFYRFTLGEKLRRINYLH